MDALKKASENGKDVTVVIELCARFDEENNLYFSEVLKRLGFFSLALDIRHDTAFERLGRYKQLFVIVIGIANGDIAEERHRVSANPFLAYPFDSMDTLVRLLDECADDPRVASIKITIYRLDHRSRAILRKNATASLPILASEVMMLRSVYSLDVFSL